MALGEAQMQSLKVGIVGCGFVGAACAKAFLLRGSCHEIVLLDAKTEKYVDSKTGEQREARRDQGLANDLSHAGLLCPPARVCAGGYENMADAAIVVITAGINEKTGRAIDRAGKGRLMLLPENTKVYRDVIPKVVSAAPNAIVLVVTDPPDPLADVVRLLAPSIPVHRIISAGTYLDTLRFRYQIAHKLSRNGIGPWCDPSSVHADVLGEHGTSQVHVWSSAQIGGVPVLKLAERLGWDGAAFRGEVAQAVRYANIDIIEGTGASQHGIGAVTARIVEAILRDERHVAPVGTFQSKFGVTLSLPSIIGRDGVSAVLDPSSLDSEERRLLDASARQIKDALDDPELARITRA